MIIVQIDFGAKYNKNNILATVVYRSSTKPQFIHYNLGTSWTDTELIYIPFLML